MDSFSSSSRNIISDVRIVKDFTFQGLLGTQRLYTVQSKSSWLINVKKLERNMKLKTWSQLKRTETKLHNLLHKQCPPYLAVKNSQRDNTDTLRCMECCHSAVVCRGPGTSLSIISFVFAFLCLMFPHLPVSVGVASFLHTVGTCPAFTSAYLQLIGISTLILHTLISRELFQLQWSLRQGCSELFLVLPHLPRSLCFWDHPPFLSPSATPSCLLNSQTRPQPKMLLTRMFGSAQLSSATHRQLSVFCLACHPHSSPVNPF